MTTRHVYPFLLFFATFALFAASGTFEFLNFDDDVYITANPKILAGLTWETARWAFSTTLGGHWHPLSWISLAGDISIFGARPGPIHLESAAIHALNTVLVYTALKKLKIAESNCLIIAAIFGVHPLRLESVVWASQRKDVLSMLLGLFALNLYLERHSLARNTITTLLYLLALLAKPTMITLPLLFLIVDFARGAIYDQASLKMFTRRNALLLISATIFAFVSYLSQRSGGGLRTATEVALGQRFDSAVISFAAYTAKLFWPSDLSIFYPRVSYASGIVSAAALLLTFLSLAAWNLRTRYPELLLGWIWFIISALPMSGIIPVGGQAYADRWTYLPHLGLITALIYAISRRYGPQTTAFSIAPVIIVLSFLTNLNLPNWKDSESIFRQALRATPDNFMAHTNLGATLDSPEQLAEQEHHYEEAVRLNPTYPEALNNLGVARAKRGRLQEALSLFERALTYRPDLLTARENKGRVLQDLARVK